MGDFLKVTGWVFVGVPVLCVWLVLGVRLGMWLGPGVLGIVVCTAWVASPFFLLGWLQELPGRLRGWMEARARRRGFGCGYSRLTD